jgi:hypothetical protein
MTGSDIDDETRELFIAAEDNGLKNTRIGEVCRRVL